MNRLRTIGIVAHIDAGKTTLAEQILCDSGQQASAGAVDDGTAAMDWMRQEQERGISIVAAATTVPWRECEIQWIDTPGHVDFTAEVERCLRVLDGLVVVVDGVRGVEAQTRTVWRHADRWRCARVAFINKLDRQGADFPAAVASLVQAFDCRAIPVVVPLHDANGGFAGLLDVLSGAAQWFAGVPTASERRCIEGRLQSGHLWLQEQCADLDEEVFADFVAGRVTAPERLRRVLRRACIEGAAVPVLAGAALLDQGVDWLLDAVCDYLPSPLERVRTGLEDAFPPADPDAPTEALVFKVEHVGVETRNFVRVFRGTLRGGTELEDARTGQRVVIDELWRMSAARHEVLELAEPGRIVVVRTASELRTGDTLRAIGVQHQLSVATYSAPVIGVCFEPATALDREPLLAGLEIQRVDDPTLRIERDVETGLPLVLGMGELHLEIVADRLREMRTCQFRCSQPRVALRGAVRQGGAGGATLQAPDGTGSASVAVEIGPVDDEELQVQLGAASECAFAAALERAIRAAAMVAGSPIRGALVRVLSASVGSVGESFEVLISQAAAYAMAKAIDQAGPMVLEPMVQFEVRCPSERRTSVHADLQKRDAQIRQVSAGQLGACIQGRGRLAAFLGYATRLRSITQGQGEVQLLPEGFEPAAIGSEAPTLSKF
jgi:elongation factor G